MSCIEVVVGVLTIEIKNEVPEYEIEMKLKLKQNIGISVDIAVVQTAQR